MSQTASDNSLSRWYQGAASRRGYRIGMIAALVIFLYFLVCELVASTAIVKTAAQVDFEKYVDAREKHVVLNEPGTLPLPHISMKILRADTETPSELVLAPGDNGAENAKVMRILTLMREAGIFGLGRRSAVSGDGIVLRIDDGEKQFETTFSRDDIRDNVKAESLLKLLTIQGKPTA